MEAYQNYLEKLYGLVIKRLLLGALRSDKKASHTVPVTEDGIETDPGNRSAREKELIDEVRSEARALYDTEETLLSGDSFAPLPYLYAACNADAFERHAAAMLLFSEISCPRVCHSRSQAYGWQDLRLFGYLRTLLLPRNGWRPMLSPYMCTQAL